MSILANHQSLVETYSLQHHPLWQNGRLLEWLPTTRHHAKLNPKKHTIEDALTWLARKKHRCDNTLLWACWSETHQLLWRLARQQHHHEWSPLHDEPKDTVDRFALEQWFRTKGISDLLRQDVAELFGTKPTPSWHKTYTNLDPIQMWTLGDVLATSPLWDMYQRPTTQLQHMCWQIVHQLVQERQFAKQALHKIREHIQSQPLPPKTTKLVNWLVELSQEIESQGILPNNPNRRWQQELELDDEFGLIFYDLGTTQACNQNMRQVVFRLDDEPWSIGTHCNDTYCAVDAAAIDCLLEKIAFMYRRGEIQRIEDLIREPIWQRNLTELIDELQSTSIPQTMDGMPAWLGWDIDGLSEGLLSIMPVMVRHKKSGKGVLSKRHFSGDCWHLMDEMTTTQDRLLLQCFNQNRRNAGQIPRSEIIEVLKHIAGHDKLYHVRNTTVGMTLEYHEGTLIFDHKENTTSIHIGLRFGDTTLRDDTLIAYSAILENEGWLVKNEDIDGHHARYVIWSVPEKLRKAMPRVRRMVQGNIPMGAQAVIQEHIISQQTPNRLPLELSENLRGERLPRRDILMVRLKRIGAALSMEILSAPIEDGPSYPPGQGPAVVYAVQSQGPVHTLRDMEAEVVRAHELRAKLNLQHAQDDDIFLWSFPIDEGLDKVAHLQTIEDHQLQVVWDTAPIRLVGETDFDAVEMTVRKSAQFFALRGQLTIEGSIVPLDQLLDALRQKKQWLQLDEQNWVKMTQRLQNNLSALLPITKQGQDDDLLLHHLATPLLLNWEQEGISLTGTTAWKNMARQVQQAHTSTLTVPDNFKGQLRPYQFDGVQWLHRLSMWAPGAILADDMGLGKTIQTLCFLLTRGGTTLIIGPTSLGFNWQREAATFAPSLTFELITTSAQLDALDAPESQCLYYMSYDLALRNIEWCTQTQWTTLVLDEAQAIKNPQTQRTRAINTIQHQFALLLTGTPMENHTGELWSLYHKAVPGLLGNHNQFKTRFRNPIEQKADHVRQNTLSTLIEPFILRRLKNQVAMDLPERTDIRLDVELSPEERTLYEEIRRSALASLPEKQEDPAERFQILAAITRLRQLACHPALIDPSTQLDSSKTSLLCEQLIDLKQQNHHALVFSQFSSLLKLVEPALTEAGLSVTMLTGSTSANQRKQRIEAFQNGQYDVFLISIKAGGIGLNLTRASYVFLLDPWWNPAVEDQATDRAHRIGQQQPVTVYRMVAKDTIEEIIYDLHQTKRNLINDVLAGTDSAAPMSLDQLQNLLTQSVEG